MTPQIMGLKLAQMIKTSLANAPSAKTKWLIHGTGTAMFQYALPYLEGQNLKNMEVFFAAPKDAVGPMLPQMKKLGIKLHDDVMKFNSHDWSSLINRCQLGGFHENLKAYGEEHNDRRAVLREQQARDGNTLFGFVQKTYKSALSLGTFAVGGFHLGGVVGAVSGVSIAAVPGFLQKAKSVRNMAGIMTNDASLNPNMHPFKSPDEFNAHVKTQHGGHGKAFLALARQLVTGNGGWG
ncbi:hypothetical protein [Marinibactrum halimedae]|uniref:Uncharacterized protein n=1 Tax=Marinibactrum halimedae TaxID=1444977 RepID=A0AA37WL48_9GAMM|nr:hypothetical protein [Marinibactrum halimedae]MCD9457677.1 hypothetical protein [Marinibactrum halimedae]GLS24950.1 hypothetical protein GCM10007877_06640 [Marinibactrum halimedae]